MSRSSSITEKGEVVDSPAYKSESHPERASSILERLPSVDAEAAPVGNGATLEAQPVSDEPPRLSTGRIVALAAGMMMTFFVAAASTSAVTLLIPSMAHDLGHTELEVQRISSAYVIAFACGLLFSGRLADSYGRKKLYMAGISVYILFGIITGAVRNRIVMSVCRAFSGLGLSIVMPAGFGIIGVNIRHEPARTIAFAAFGLGNPVGGAFGGLVGGVMASISSRGYSYLFYLLSGIAALLLIPAYFVIPPDPQTLPKAVIDKRIDWLGGGLVTGAVCLFTFSMTESGIALDGWRTPYVPALLAVSLLLAVAFVFWSIRLERHTSYPPIIKMSLFSRRKGLISYTCACCFFQSISVMGWTYTSTIFYQNYKGLTPFQNSISTLTSTIVGAFAASSVMFFAPRVAARHLIGIGAVLTALCSVLYALVPEGLTFWAMEFPAQILIPWGIDFAYGLGNILISNLVDQDEQSVGGALFQTSGQVGAALGICLTSLIVAQIGEMRDSVLTGVRAGFWFGAATGLIVTPIAYFGYRKVRLAKDVGNVAL